MKPTTNTLKRRAKQLARRLEGNPDLLTRFESILQLAESDEGQSLDKIEEQLIEQVRGLGNDTLVQYSHRYEQRLCEQMKSEEGVQQREKKTKNLQ